MLSITNKNSFLIDEDIDITQQYLKNGFYIAPAADKIALSWIQSSFLKIIKDELNIKTVMHVDKGVELFKDVGYTGDYYWFYHD